MGKYSVDLNSDLGESFGAYTIGMDADVLSFVSSANIACGFHAGPRRYAQNRGLGQGARRKHGRAPWLSGFSRLRAQEHERERKRYA